MSHDLNRSLGLTTRDVVVKDESKAIRVDFEAVKVMLAESLLPEGRRSLGLHHQDICFWRGGCEAWEFRKLFAKPSAKGMVVCEAVNHCLEGHDPGCSENSRLPHASSQTLPPPARGTDQFARPDQDGANRRAESFAQAKTGRIDWV